MKSVVLVRLSEIKIRKGLLNLMVGEGREPLVKIMAVAPAASVPASSTSSKAL